MQDSRGPTRTNQSDEDSEDATGDQLGSTRNSGHTKQNQIAGKGPRTNKV
jgi:hypothetical protein